MSKALIKKSLELIELNANAVNDNHKKKSKSGLLDLIPISHRIVYKKKTKGSSIVLKRSSKLTVSEAKKQLESQIDPTDENVRRLLLLSSNTLDTETSEKVITRGIKKHYILKKEKPVEEEKTVFTEEDFQKFEAEYFG